MPWKSGDPIVRREMLRGRPWMGTTVFVVADDPDLLVTYLPERAEFAFPDGSWPTATGRHPWHGRGAWEGHGVLMLNRPSDHYAVWHFWKEPGRAFAGCYLNLEEPLRRTALGYDTQDLELDVWIPANGDGAWSFKDDELLEVRVREGRFTTADVERIRGIGAEIGSMLDTAGRWWDDGWSSWSPPHGWNPEPLPEGWDVV
jgi:Protein of unknown function (DUF402)